MLCNCLYYMGGQGFTITASSRFGGKGVDKLEAEAAWLTCWSQVVGDSGLTVMSEPTSSNSKSSVSEAACRRSVTFCGLPVLATPWGLAHWLELSPVWETSKD